MRECAVAARTVIDFGTQRQEKNTSKELKTEESLFERISRRNLTASHLHLMPNS